MSCSTQEECRNLCGSDNISFNQAIVNGSLTSSCTCYDTGDVCTSNGSDGQNANFEASGDQEATGGSGASGASMAAQVVGTFCVVALVILLFVVAYWKYPQHNPWLLIGGIALAVVAILALTGVF